MINHPVRQAAPKSQKGISHPGVVANNYRVVIRTRSNFGIVKDPVAGAVVVVNNNQQAPISETVTSTTTNRPYRDDDFVE